MPSGSNDPGAGRGQDAPSSSAQHLGIDFGGLTAVDEFNITIGRTEIAGLIGPNGAGKTTVFNLLTKVYQPTRGTILLDGVDTHNMNTVQVNKAGIARTFQNIRLFNDLTVEDNVNVGMHNSRCTTACSAAFSACPGYWKEEKTAHERALELLLHLPHAGSGRGQGRLPALRRPAPSGDRPRAGNQPVPAAAGRAGGGHEPLRDRGADGEHPSRSAIRSRSPFCSSSTT